MKVESQTTVGRRSMTPTSSTAKLEGGLDWSDSPSVARIIERLGDGSPRFLARAPGRLNLMGGLGEYTGGLVLNAPIAQHVCVGIRRCADAKISIANAGSADRNEREPFVILVSRLFKGDGTLIDPLAARQFVDDCAPDAARCVLGTIVEMVRAGLVPNLEGGLLVAVVSAFDGVRDAGSDAALAAATAAALAGAYDVTPDPLQIAAVCQRVENDWLQSPVGIGDAMCALLGEPGVLGEVCCESRTFAGSVRLPNHLAVLGIDCGAVCPDAKLKFERVRTATFMGRSLIDRIIRHDGAGRLQWNGYLSQISVTDYVERFRDRLPTRLKGSEYLARFGETGDPLTKIERDFVYKIRSRTEHHIYEHARARQLVECLSRAIRNDDERALKEAGEVMYASHWSYGQRCGLGSVETDFLVNLLRADEGAAGTFGAKVTARGCGGVVGVLMRADERATAAVDAAVAAYESKTGHRATRIGGSSAGALVDVVRRM